MLQVVLAADGYFEHLADRHAVQLVSARYTDAVFSVARLRCHLFSKRSMSPCDLWISPLHDVGQNIRTLSV